MLRATGVTTIPFLHITLASSWPVLYATGVVTVGSFSGVLLNGQVNAGTTVKLGITGGGLYASQAGAMNDIHSL